MSFLNKVGLEKLSKYNALQDSYNLQSAQLLELESKLIVTQEQMRTMSDVPNLRDQLDYMNERYEKMKREMAKHGDV
jgi:ubiquinone biosynthesis protein UbiJ